jgi:alkenylglycerophosphocholine/alkenylglycerophosphoethanolamine hydrolase
MISALMGLAVFSACCAIAADWEERRNAAFYVMKPLTTLLIIAIASLAPASTYQHYLLLALGLSLCGDACLMFDGTRWFVAGLTSFLFAHLAFIAAFLHGVHGVELPVWLAAVAVYAVVLMVLLLPRAGSLKLPVIAYVSVLMAMVFAAAARNAQLGSAASHLALAGALLFSLSDSLLGWRRFRGKYRGAQALILSSYWLAIGLIAASA